MKAGMEKVMEEKVKEKMTKMEEQKNEVSYNFSSFILTIHRLASIASLLIIFGHLID